MERREKEFLEYLAKFIEARNILEVGVQAGDVATNLCAAAKYNDGKYVGVDIWAQHGLGMQHPPIGSQGAVEAKLSSLGFENFKFFNINTATQRDLFIKTITENFPEGIDLAFIDGCHSYTGVANDFFAIYPLLSKCGVIVLHDTLRIDGCREFALDLRRKFNDGTFDIIDMPFGYGHRRCGLTLIARRSYPILDIGIDEVCGSVSACGIIETEELEHYASNIGKYEMPLFIQHNKLTNNFGFYDRKKFDR